MRESKVSIFVLNFNGLEDSKKCLQSILKTDYPNFEILFLDNGSKVNELEILKDRFKDIRIKFFRSKVNLGFTGGNNFLLKKTKAKYIVLLNNDTEVDPSWLGAMVKMMEKDKRIGIVQPKIKLMDKREYFDYAGAAGGFIDKYGYPFTRGRIFDTIERDEGQYDNVREIFWASGAAALIRRSIIPEIGGLFSENLFNYMEEIDLCWRVWNRGYKVMFTPESIVYHKVASTSKRNIIKKKFWEHRNNLFILTRNLNRNNLIRILIPRFLMEIATYIGYILRGEYKYLLSLLLAHVDYLRRAIYIRYKRNRLPNKKDLPVYKGSIIIDYFLLKKKHFSQIMKSQTNKISYLLFNTKGSGGLNAIIKQAKELEKSGYDINFYTFLPGRKEIKGVQIKNFWKFLTERHNIIVSTFWPTAYLIFLKKSDKKVYFVQDWEVDFHKNPIFRLLAKYSYRIPVLKIVISNYLQQKLITNNVDPDLIKQIKYSVLDNNYKNNFAKKARKDKIRVLSVVSRYNIHKGVDLLDKAIKNLKDKNSKMEFTLVSMEEKPYSDNFDKFYSNIDHNKLSKLYKQSDVLLVTSRTEGFYIPGLEAMASGCIVITSNCKGIKEYVIEDKNAIVYNDLEELWEKNLIEKALSKNKREKILKNALATAKEYLTESLGEDLIKNLN